jgi:hypothetical protein
MAKMSELRYGSVFFLSVLVATLGSACNAPTSPTPAPSATPAPAPTPTQYTATPVPFNLTESRTFDIVGWDSWPSAPTPATIQFRWNAAIGNYEILEAGNAEWSRLEALSSRTYEYDVFGSGGTKLPFSMVLFAPPHQAPSTKYVGNVRIFEGSWARAYFAFGLATEPADAPVSGTTVCDFGEDEIGGGALTFDHGAGTLSGWGEPFWGRGVRYDLVQTSFARGATTFAARFGTGGVLEGRFFGPGAVNVAVRAKGGGQGSANLSGIMTGVCER